MRILNSLLTSVLGMACLLPTAGCQDLQELNHSTFITAVAMEPGEESKFRITAEFLNASEAQSVKGGKGTTPAIIQSSESNSVGEALVKLNVRVDRNMNGSHIGVVIIDERLARKGLHSYVDALQRTRYLREDALILISKDTPASDILKVLYPRGAYPSLKIQSQVNHNRQNWGGAEASRLFDLNLALVAKGREPVLTAVTLKGPPGPGRKLDNIRSVTPTSIVELAGTAVFRKDRMIGYLSLENTRMLQIAAGHLKETTLSVPMDQPGQFASVRVTKIHSRREVTMNSGKPSIKLTVRLEGNITGTDTELNLQEVAGYQKIEDLTNAYVKQQLDAALDVIQHEFGVDTIGFGEKLYRWHYKQFEPVAAEWNELFAASDVEVAVHSELQRSELKTQHILQVEHKDDPGK